jgi:tetratricopeptide (TPR) repeat protein
MPTVTPLAALELAERAVTLDPLDARNHLVMAWTTALLRRFEQSVVHYELAAELNPNNPRTLVSAALGLTFMGRKEDAARLLDRAMALTSLFLDYQWSHIATIRYFNGDLEGVIQAADRSKNVIIDTPGWKAAALYRLGRRPEASAALAQLYEIVAAAWGGPRLPTQEDILDWFISAFPIRREEDIAGLNKALREIEYNHTLREAPLGPALPATR